MTANPLTGLAVLVLEDNSTNLLLVRAILERAGCQVSEARSADEARQLLHAATPDILLMDIGLPGEDGISLTRNLKATAATASIPIVALTAHAMQRDRDRALAAGCDGYLSKPFRSQHLADEIVRVLRTV